jgi:hypothetical protein
MPFEEGQRVLSITSAQHLPDVTKIAKQRRTCFSVTHAIIGGKGCEITATGTFDGISRANILPALDP